MQSPAGPAADGSMHIEFAHENVGDGEAEEFLEGHKAGFEDHEVSDAESETFTEPEGAFIHPHDLEEELEDDRFEEAVIWPGVIRPWAEALEIAREEAFEETVYDPATGDVYPLIVAPSALEKMSLGVSLYLSGTNSLLLIMLVVCVFATPQLAFNMYAQYKYQTYSTREDSFAGLTLGAQQTVQVDESGALTGQVTYYGYSKDDALMASSMLDVVYVTIFLAGVLYTRHSQGARVAEKERGRATIGRYSIEVRGAFTQELMTSQLAKELKEHFEEITGEGSVREVSIASMQASVLDLMAQKRKYLSMRKMFASSINRSRGTWGGLPYDVFGVRVTEADDKIALAMAQRDPIPAVAFVTFESVAFKEECLLEYLNPLSKLRQPEYLFFKGERLTVRQAPEPEDLHWSHITFFSLDKFARSFVVVLLTVLWITLTFLIVTMADVQSEELPVRMDYMQTRAAGTLFCDASFMLDNSITNATEDALGRTFVQRFLNQDFDAVDCRHYVGNGIFLGADPAGPVKSSSLVPIDTDPDVVASRIGELSYQCAAFSCYGAYCTAKGLSAWFFNQGNGLYGYCYHYWNTWAKGTGTLVAATAVSKGVEETIEYVASYLADFEKHHTVSKTNMSTSRKCFWASLVNMLLILIIVFGHIVGFPSTGLGGIPFLFGGKYTDFDREWFAEVGSAFIRTMAAQTIVPHMIYASFVVCIRLKNYLSRNMKVNQHELNRSFQGAEFDLPTRYGQLHATIFVALTLSSGIPIMTHFVCGYLVIAFILDRVVLLRYAEKPNVSDHTLSFASLDLLPLAVIFHYCIGVWMFAAAGDRYVAGDNYNSIGSDTAALQQAVAEVSTFSDQFNIRKRILKMCALPQFVALVVTMVLLFVYYYGKFLRTLYDSISLRPTEVDMKARVSDEAKAYPELASFFPAHAGAEGKAAGTPAKGDKGDAAGGRSEGGHTGRSVPGLEYVRTTSTVAGDGTPFVWSGPLAYDMTTDKRHRHEFAAIGLSGDGLSLDEATNFTVFDHGGRGRVQYIAKERRLRRMETLAIRAGALDEEEEEEGEEEEEEEEEGEGPERVRPSTQEPEPLHDRVSGWLDRSAAPGDGAAEDGDEAGPSKGKNKKR